MNRSTAQAIGDEVGVFMEMEAEANQEEIVAGRFLHIKVRLDIRKPLMRGVTIDLGDGKEDRWYPLSYEYLPEFCYCCGIIEHTDRSCLNVDKKAVKAFGRELRFIPPKRRPGGDGGRLGMWRSSEQGGSGRANGGSGGTGSSSRGSGARSRSDAPSWRKSPEKLESKKGGTGDILAEMTGGEKGGAGDVNSTMQADLIILEETSKNGEQVAKERGKGSFRRMQREKEVNPTRSSVSEGGRKRAVEDLMKLNSDLALKKAKLAEKNESGVVSDVLKAGLSEQLRGTQ